MRDRKRHLVTGSICRNRSSGQRALPCVNTTIIYESHCRLIDEEMNRREGWTATEIKAYQNRAVVEVEIYCVQDR